MNVSFGIEFDDDVMCAVDKLERDYVLKEATNSCHSVLEPSPHQREHQDEQSHRKEKFSRRKVGENLPGSSRRKVYNSGIEIGNVKLDAGDEAMSLTVINGHGSGGKVFLSPHDEAADRDIVCTWNSPLLVSTPAMSTPAIAGSSRRRVANENTAKSNNADGAVMDTGGPTVTPRRRNSARKPRTTNAEKTKLFRALLNASMNASSPVEAANPPGSSGKCNSTSNDKGNLSSAISDPDSEF